MMRDRFSQWLDRRNRVIAWPGKRSEQLAVLTVLAQRIASGRTHSEKDINTILGGAVATRDHVFFRRELVDCGFLVRTRDGSAYERPVRGPLPETLSGRMLALRAEGREREYEIFVPDRCEPVGRLAFQQDDQIRILELHASSDEIAAEAVAMFRQAALENGHLAVTAAVNPADSKGLAFWFGQGFEHIKALEPNRLILSRDTF